MSDVNNNPNLKPLAFTETAGGSSFPRAVYRSGELWRYCVALAEAGSTPSAEFMYRQYLTDKDVVVIDDNTLFTDRLDPEQLIEWQQRIIAEGQKTLAENDVNLDYTTLDLSTFKLNNTEVTQEMYDTALSIKGFDYKAHDVMLAELLGKELDDNDTEEEEDED